MAAKHSRQPVARVARRPFTPWPKGPAKQQEPRVITTLTNITTIVFTPKQVGDDESRLASSRKKLMGEVYCRGTGWESCEIIIRFPDKHYCFYKPAGDQGQPFKRTCSYEGGVAVFPDEGDNT